MPTIYRLKSKDLYDIAKLLQPNLSDETLKGYNADKLKLIISEWLLLNDFSTLHLFEKNANSAWIHPKENQCDCCWKFRVGRRKLSIPSIDAIDRNPSPRESQMIYNGGPWVMVSDDQNKQGKSKIRVRSHLLHTTYEKSVYIKYM
uniref:Uncharacterized protein n=1 Tax=Panagrolaimus sp. PS1159 TaxID=55785 RepID=A0AC35GVP1_9BILA